MIKDMESEEEYRSLQSACYYLKAYSLFAKAKNLGVRFSPRDIDLQTMMIFDLIQTTGEDILKKKEKLRHGKRQTKSPVRATRRR